MPKPNFRIDPDKVYTDECPECEGTGLNKRVIQAGDETVDFFEDDPCEECGGSGEVELDYDEVLRRMQEQYESEMEDRAMDRYYHEKYGDDY